MIGGFSFAGGAVRRAFCEDWDHSPAKDLFDTGLTLVMISLLILAGSLIWCVIALAVKGGI